MDERIPVVLIVGKPNVGKSTLFNRIVGYRKSIVDEKPGVTIDTIYDFADLNGGKIMLVDTWGITRILKDDEITRKARERTVSHILNGDLILFLVDGKEGITSDDLDIAEMLKKTGTKVLLVANKTENLERFRRYILPDLYSLGFGDPIEISAVHSRGIGELLDRITEELERMGLLSKSSSIEQQDVEEDEKAIKVAIVGRPNVGKSSLFNRILNRERAIVTSIPGTTKDSIDDSTVIGGKKYIFIDTAGMRRKSRVEMKTVESYGILRAVRSIERADVVLLVLDAVDGVRRQDQKIAGLIERRKKASIVLFNKSDLLREGETDILRREFEERLYFIRYSPLIFTSAKTGYGVEKIIPSVNRVYGSYTRRIPTSVVNVALRRFLLLNPPPSTKRKRLKIYYGSQVEVKPPVFLFFVNDAKLVNGNYERKIENMVRGMIDSFEGSPIVVRFKQRR